MCMVELKGVTKILGNAKVLDNINLKVEKGAMVALVGANGSGKSMLLRVIAGLLAVSEGEVLVDQKKVDPLKQHPVSVGVMIEQPGFWMNWTGYENLKFLASLNGTADKAALIKLLDVVGLSSAKDMMYRKYSMGMKQRLAFAQAIMDDPELLVLDEPTNGLDAAGSSLVLDLLTREKEKGKTIIMTSHINEHLQYRFDSVYRIDGGALVEQTV